MHALRALRGATALVRTSSATLTPAPMSTTMRMHRRLLATEADYPNDRRYTEKHEWAKVDGGVATVGITHHAQNALGDIVFVDLPDVGFDAVKGETASTVESVKTAADIYAPMSGKVVEVNTKLSDAPELINKGPHDDGWIFRVEVSDKSELDALHDNVAYAKLCEEEE